MGSNYFYDGSTMKAELVYTVSTWEVGTDQEGGTPGKFSYTDSPYVDPPGMKNWITSY